MRIYFLIFGVLFLILSALLFFRRMRIIFYGASAIGTVLRIESRESEDSILHFPVISFVDNDGVQYTFTSTSGVALGKSPSDTKVLIRYSTSNPKIAYIANWRHMWGGPIAILFLGVTGIWAAIGHTAL
ncbi:hypothetical protein GCM10011613_35820 [Cellvibrio zantedeschiae]|uniref:DUF3592 domain-containing protein n=1 Tax=Cellvibrio zantedeschiae TaxID=1237077 RepID=A0ABQ3BEW1_9GAMM|nr:DUF3592 domain-containing protein [Cellvibrio zantedeschiae]GGY87467.1 hypothetical protein GCM10011613_35820 [Cellvibrio zantedeschiae]